MKIFLTFFVIQFFFSLAHGEVYYFDKFTNRELKQLLEDSKKHQRKGIIYTWTPRMIYSIEGIKELLRLEDPSDELFLDLDLTFLLDPTINDDYALEALQAEFDAYPNHPLKNQTYYLMTKTRSKELYHRGVLIHYPSYVFYENGEIIWPYIPGYIQMYEDDNNPHKLHKMVSEKFKRQHDLGEK